MNRTRWLKMAGVIAALGIGSAPDSQARWGYGQGEPQGGGPKRVVIDKSQQELRAYEGNQLVFESRISTGKQGKETPNGQFRAKNKSLMHRSRLYNNAPMPYSVQIGGNYFIHGFQSVPTRPASHGCIRLPLGGDNPARQFYDWVEPGTPVSIVGAWGK